MAQALFQNDSIDLNQLGNVATANVAVFREDSRLNYIVHFVAQRRQCSTICNWRLARTVSAQI